MVIYAHEGMWLFNGETFAKEVHIGKYDSPDNWQEVTDEFKQEWEHEHDGGADDGENN